MFGNQGSAWEVAHESIFEYSYENGNTATCSSNICVVDQHNVKGHLGCQTLNLD